MMSSCGPRAAIEKGFHGLFFILYFKSKSFDQPEKLILKKNNRIINIAYKVVQAAERKKKINPNIYRALKLVRTAPTFSVV